MYVTDRDSANLRGGFENVDFIITTYTRVLADHKIHVSGGTDRKAFLFNTSWSRIIFDESTFLKNPNSGTTKACLELKADHVRVIMACLVSLVVALDCWSFTHPHTHTHTRVTGLGALWHRARQLHRRRQVPSQGHLPGQGEVCLALRRHLPHQEDPPPPRRALPRHGPLRVHAHLPHAPPHQGTSPPSLSLSVPLSLSLCPPLSLCPSLFFTHPYPMCAANRTPLS